VGLFICSSDARLPGLDRPAAFDNDEQGLNRQSRALPITGREGRPGAGGKRLQCLFAGEESFHSVSEVLVHLDAGETIGFASDARARVIRGYWSATGKDSKSGELSQGCWFESNRRSKAQVRGLRSGSVQDRSILYPSD
jgi:hypothetical protein